MTFREIPLDIMRRLCKVECGSCGANMNWDTIEQQYKEGLVWHTISLGHKPICGYCSNHDGQPSS